MYFAYILRCADGTLYTGYTDDLQRRLQAHNGGKGAKYTRSRRPLELAYSEGFASKPEAMSREAAIKRLARQDKLRLISNAYHFAPAAEAELEAVYDIIDRRVRWLAQNGIDQWTGYWDAYPREYYRDKLNLGQLYVLRKSPNCRVVGTAVLLEADPRWDGREQAPACYIHNLATDTAEPGAGKAILEAAESLARQRGKERMRLDCRADNARLNEYYEQLGFSQKGTCADGKYTGTLREKALHPPAM